MKFVDFHIFVCGIVALKSSSQLTLSSYELKFKTHKKLVNELSAISVKYSLSCQKKISHVERE